MKIHPQDKNCLINRGKCYNQSGTPELGQKDAEEALLADPKCFKAVFLKAECLYTRGDFEHALVFYHRGHQLRPELAEFRIGIQKSAEAIENSIGGKQKITNKTVSPSRKVSSPKLDPKVVAELLGELAEDHKYLQDLINDKDFADHPNMQVTACAIDGMNFLSARIEFWRQQNPIYARKSKNRQ